MHGYVRWEVLQGGTATLLKANPTRATKMHGTALVPIWYSVSLGQVINETGTLGQRTNEGHSLSHRSHGLMRLSPMGL